MTKGGVIARSRLRNPLDPPSPGGRELEGGGNSPSPYSSPIKGEEISAEIARHTVLSQRKTFRE